MELIEQGKELALNGKYTEALELFKKALEKDRKNPDLLFFIGTCYSSLGEFSVAKFYYQETLRIEPNHSRTKKIWDGLEEVEARPPQDLKASPRAIGETIAVSSDRGSSDVGGGLSANTTHESADRSAAGFPDTMLETDSRGDGVGIWLWVLVALVAAALVYFVVGPWFLK